MAPTKGTATITLPTDTQILIRRELDAPRHLVWKAWTTPELVTRFWAGERGTVTVAEIDLRVGGAWRYVLRVDGGMEITFHGTFREIVPGERLVSTELMQMPGVDELPEEAAPVNTVTFTEADGRTTLTLLTEAHSTELRDMIVGSGMETGVQEQLDALELLAIELGAGG